MFVVRILPHGYVYCDCDVLALYTGVDAVATEGIKLKGYKSNNKFDTLFK